MVFKNSHYLILSFFLMLATYLNFFDIPGVNISILIIILYILYKEISRHPLSALTIIFFILITYFLIRVTLLELNVFDFFYNLKLNSSLLNDVKWIQVIILFTFSFLIGYKAKINNHFVNLAYKYDGNAFHLKKLPITVSLFLFLFSMFFFILYIQNMGGINSLLNNYDTDTFKYVSNDDRLSLLKNLTIYFLYSSLILFLTYVDAVDLKKFLSLRKFFKILPIILAIIIASSFTRRGLIINILLFIYTFWNIKVKKIYFGKNSIYLLIAFFFLYSIFIFRSFEDNKSFFELFLLGFDKGEFFVFDQYINAVYNGESILGTYHYGILHFKSLIFYLIPFNEYESFDKLLVFKSIGIEKWGIPPTIIGYAYLFGGIFLLPFYSFMLGYICAFIENICLKNINKKEIYLSIYMIYLSYIWILFRNADPLIAIYFINRWILLVLISYLFIYIFSKKR